MLDRPYMKIANRVVDSPPELLDSYEVTAELHFTGSATSNVNCGAIHDATDKLWISFWFRLDTAIPSGGDGTTYHIFGKYDNGTNYWVGQLSSGDGKFYLLHTEGAGVDMVVSAETAWDVGWHHIVCSCSTVAGQRLIVDGGAAVADAGNQTAISLTAVIVLGNRTDGGTSGLIGEMKEVVIGTDDLSGAEEAALLQGIVPVDATQYYPLNEGTGAVAFDYGSGGNNGTIDTAKTWEGTGAQASITLSQIPAGYGELMLIWEDLIVNNAAAQNLQLTLAGGAGEYDYSNLAFGTISNSTNGANFILLGTCGDVPGVGRKSSGSLRIFNRYAQEKVIVGTEVGVASGQTTLHDLFGFHVECKDRTSDEEVSTMTITPAAGSFMGGGKVYLLGVK